MPTFEQSRQRIIKSLRTAREYMLKQQGYVSLPEKFIRFVQESRTTLASGLAALLIIVVGFLIFNFFLNVNKDTVPQETTTEEATESAELNPTSTPTPPGETTSTAQVSPGGAASITQQQEYTVVKGDNLGRISQKFYGDSKKWAEIAKANKLANPSLIHTGNKLIIPKLETGVASTSVTPAPVGDRGSNVEYVVTKGDTLWQIAIDFYGTGFDWYKIRDANLDKVGTLANGRPRITPGQHLIIP